MVRDARPSPDETFRMAPRLTSRPRRGPGRVGRFGDDDDVEHRRSRCADPARQLGRASRAGAHGRGRRLWPRLCAERGRLGHPAGVAVRLPRPAGAAERGVGRAQRHAVPTAGRREAGARPLRGRPARRHPLGGGGLRGGRQPLGRAASGQGGTRRPAGDGPRPRRLHRLPRAHLLWTGRRVRRHRHGQARRPEGAAARRAAGARLQRGGRGPATLGGRPHPPAFQLAPAVDGAAELVRGGGGERRGLAHRGRRVSGRALPLGRPQRPPRLGGDGQPPRPGGRLPPDDQPAEPGRVPPRRPLGRLRQAHGRDRGQGRRGRRAHAHRPGGPALGARPRPAHGERRLRRALPPPAAASGSCRSTGP